MKSQIATFNDTTIRMGGLLVAFITLHRLCESLLHFNVHYYHANISVIIFSRVGARSGVPDEVFIKISFITKMSYI